MKVKPDVILEKVIKDYNLEKELKFVPIYEKSIFMQTMEVW